MAHLHSRWRRCVSLRDAPDRLPGLVPRLFRLCITALLLTALAAPAASAPAPPAPNSPWYVYRDGDAADNHGHWTNAVPAGAWAMLRLDLVDQTAPAGGTTAIRLDVTLTGPWCGLIVLSAPDYWGDRPGEGFDLSDFTTVAFRARGLQGGEQVRIKAAVAGDQPFGDAALLPVDSGWIELTAQWQDYRVDVDGRDLSRVVTPFMVIANDKHTPTRRMTIFLDDIRYERRE
jgi:hypothetical protein